MHLRTRLAAALAVAAVCAASDRAAAQFTAGDLVIYQAGDGSTSLVNTGNVVVLKEFVRTGGSAGNASGFSVTLPSTGTGAKLIASGTAPSEGLLTLGNGGQTLALTGYNATPGGSSLQGSAAATVNRAVALVNGQGTAGFTLLSDFADASNPRGAYTTNGSDIWVAGGAGGVRYTTAGSTTSTQLSTTVTNLRGVAVSGGQLYVSTNSGSAVRLGAVGTGTPTSGGQTIANLPGFPTAGSPYQFFFARLGNPGFAGPNVVYVADDSASNGSGVNVGQIQKYTFDGTTWAAAGTVVAGVSTSATTGIRGLTGLVTGDNQVTLYGTTGGSGSTGGGTIFTATDNNVVGGSISGTAGTLGNGAGTNTAFRGIAFSPARLEWSGGDGTWDLSATRWRNTAPTTPVASQRPFNAYAANFGDTSADATVTVNTGINPAAVNVTNSANTYTFTDGTGSSGIQGLAALTKTGAGTLVLAGPNTYAGGTVVGGGTLIANNATGSATGFGSVTVNSGGTLRGEGIITGAVTVNAGGTVRGGSPANPTSPLTVGNTVSVLGAASGGGTLAVDLNGAAASGATVGRLDLSTGTGALNFQTTGAGSGPVAIRLLNDSGLQAGTPYTFTIANGQANGFTLNGSPVGAYTYGTDFTLASATFASFGGVSLTVDSGNNLVLSFTGAPVPEPAAVLALAAGGLGLGAAARRILKVGRHPMAAAP